MEDVDHNSPFLAKARRFDWGLLPGFLEADAQGMAAQTVRTGDFPNLRLLAIFENSTIHPPQHQFCENDPCRAVF